MSKSADAFRTISEVAELLETPTHVLRFWESRFPQVKPVKGAGGRRYYRPDDVQLLAGIKKLLHDEGMTIRGVQKMLREQGAKQIAARVELSLDAAPAEPVLDDTPDTAAAPAEPITAEPPDAVETDAADTAEPPADPTGTLLTPRVASWRQASLFDAPAEETTEIIAEIDSLSLVEIEDDSPDLARPDLTEEVPEAPIALDVEEEEAPEALARVVSLLVAGSTRTLAPEPEPAPIEAVQAPLAALARGLAGLDLAMLGTADRMRLLAACDRLSALQARMGQPPRALPR